MTPHVVGLQGHTGRIGSAVLKAIIEHHNAGKLVLVILHRPGSNLSSIPKGVESREIDLSRPDESKIKAAVKGLNVLVSVISFFGFGDQVHLFKALSETPGFVTYFTPLIGHPLWTVDKIKDSRVEAFVNGFTAVTSRVKDVGVGLTSIQTGVFTDYFFDLKYLGTDFDSNTVVIPTGAETQRLALVTSECLGHAISEIVSRPPESIRDQTFYAFDYCPTGDEIIQVFSKIHGAKPTVVAYTEKDYNEDIESMSMKTGAAIYRNSWGSGDWNWAGQRLGEENKNFQQLAEKYQASRQK